MRPSPELAEKLLDLYAAMSSGNADSVEALYSLDAGSVFIGTSADEFWTDSRQHNTDVRSFFDGSYGRLQVTASSHPIAVVEGTAGWTIDRPTLRLFDGSTLVTRLTLIWHRDGSEWRIVHSHISVGQ